MRLELIACLVVLLAGCASGPATRTPPIPTVTHMADRPDVAEASSEDPVVLRGCAWDYDRTDVTFEVWASQDLVQWTLATNTLAKIALFPVKQMEFYKVRARDELGQVSDWATVAR